MQTLFNQPAFDAIAQSIFATTANDEMSQGFLESVTKALQGDSDTFISEQTDANLLASAVVALDNAYRKGNELVSDAIYDQCFFLPLKSIAPDHPAVSETSMGADDGEGIISGELVKHTRPMLSTDKAYTKEQVEAFVKRCVTAAKEVGLPIEQLTFKATAKLDGMACRDENGVLVTRGNDGVHGTNITRVLERGLVIEEGERSKGDGEVVVVQQYFTDVLAPQFDMKHPRNFIVGFCGADDIMPHHAGAVAAKAIKFVPYATLPRWTGGVEALLEQYDNLYDEHTSSSPYLTDGLIVEVEQQAVKDHMGANSHHHRWMLAIKRRGKTMTPTVTNIVWQVGRTGVITPVAEYESSFLSGGNLTRATLANAQALIDKGCGVGAVIEIIRAGEVIPHIENILTPAPVVIPECCPCCGGNAEMDGVFLVCANSATCPAQASRTLEHFFKTIKIDEYGPKACQKIVEAGFARIEQVLGITTQEFMSMGFGERIAIKLKKQQQMAQMKPVEDWRFLASIGMSLIGRSMSKRLLEMFTLEELLDGQTVKYDLLLTMDKVKDKTATKIMNGLSENRERIAGLKDRMTLVRSGKAAVNDNHSQESVISGSDKLAGLNFVFTGTFTSMDREAVKNHCKTNGGTPQSSVNGKTNYLVCGEKVGQKKIEAAQDKGVKVITEQQYFEMI